MAFNIRCSYYLLELSQRCCFAQTVENKKGFLWQRAGQRRATASSGRQGWPEPFCSRGLALPPLREASLTPLLASVPLPYKCLPNLFNRQLDYNQISCIEDGAFRALRDLEVL